MSEFTVGHEREKAQIEKAIDTSSGCIVLGSAGVGKTHLLQQIARKYHKRAVYLQYSNQVKANLEMIIKRLDPKIRKQIKASDDKDFVTFKLPNRRIDELIHWIKELIDPRDRRGRPVIPKGGRPVIIFDHFEKVTASSRPLFDVLIDKAIIIISTTATKPQDKYIGRAWWGLPQINLSPLSDAESAEILWRLLIRHSYKESNRIEKMVLKLARGRPLAIERIAHKIKSGVPLHEVASQDYEGTKQGFSVTLILIVCFCAGGWYITRESVWAMAMSIAMIFTFRQIYNTSKRPRKTNDADDVI
jgi:hypothetical protein